MLSAFGLFRFLVRNLALVLDEFNRPGVIHGSLFMNILFVLTLRKGNDLSNAVMYNFANVLYALFGQFISRN